MLRKFMESISLENVKVEHTNKFEYEKFFF